MNSMRATKTEAPQVLAEWLTFPALAEAWAESPDKTIAHMAERAADYRKRSGAGSPAERVQARLIAATYLRVQSVLEELYTLQPTAVRGKNQEA